MAGVSADRSGLISARWIGAGGGAKNEALGAAAARKEDGATGAAVRPMAASKNALCAAWRAPSAPELAGVWRGKALGRIGVTDGRLGLWLTSAICGLVDQRAVNSRAVSALASASFRLVYLASTLPSLAIR